MLLAKTFASICRNPSGDLQCSLTFLNFYGVIKGLFQPRDRTSEVKIVLIKSGPHSVIPRIFPPASLCSLGLKLFDSILTSVLLSVGLIFCLNQLKPILVILSNVIVVLVPKCRKRSLLLSQRFHQKNSCIWPYICPNILSNHSLYYSKPIACIPKL